MNIIFKLILPPVILSFLFVAGCSTGRWMRDKYFGPLITQYLHDNPDAFGTSRQLIFVVNNNHSSSDAGVIAMEKVSGTWKPAFGIFPAVIGRNGFADIGKKVEGDGRTPGGIFRLGPVFGYAGSVQTKMPYRQATENDFWVDDENSDDYNLWVHGAPAAASYEKMRRDDDVYKYGIVVQYNTHPVVKGKGSAIFFHIRMAGGQPTSGCIGMEEEKIRRLIAWLEPEKEPLVILGPAFRR